MVDNNWDLVFDEKDDVWIRGVIQEKIDFLGIHMYYVCIYFKFI